MEDTQMLDEALDLWADRVLEGFAEEVNALEEGVEVYLSDVAQVFTDDLSTLMLNDALQICKQDPEYSWDYLHMKRALYLTSAQLIETMMGSIEQMHDIEVMEEGEDTISSDISSDEV